MVAIRSAYRLGPLPMERCGCAAPRPRTPGELLLAEIEAFLALRQMSPAQFGLRAANNCSLVPRLRAGLKPQAITVRRVRAFIAEHDL